MEHVYKYREIIGKILKVLKMDDSIVKLLFVSGLVND